MGFKISKTFQGKREQLSETDLLKAKVAELEAKVKELTPKPISEEKK